MHRTLLATAAAGCLTALSLAAPATSDPAHGFPVHLVCDNGQTYDLVVSGNGDFTPAHDTASNTMFIPTWFGPFHGVVTDDDGNVVDEFTDPAVSKGKSNKTRRTTTTCTFEIHDVFDDPEDEPDLGPLHFDGEGSVRGFTTPAR